ncbi:MAG: YibE/F family protein [Spirochaetaceae bacterium]|nr:YibE/F family protein [Spirochaetaceae bacterium]
MPIKKTDKKEILPLILCGVFFVILLLLPTGFEQAAQFKDAEKSRARVLSVSNDRIINTGLIRTGQQLCTVEILGGKLKGITSDGYNTLNGSLESDKIFSQGDIVQCVIHYEKNNNEYVILSLSLIDHYRIHYEIILFFLFAVLIIIFAGKTGLRSLFSFVLSILSIWKILIPLLLKGVNPLLIGMSVSLFLTVLIISLVYGFDKRCLSACTASFAGILVTALLSIICSAIFKIHGAVMPYSESLLYSGFAHLNLTGIFTASIFIGASGAMMDLSVDITSAVHEIVQLNPDISKKRACISGMNVARAAIGTMTTTLLLAYSGGYIALLMVFMAQGTPIQNILNYRYIASEIIHTLAGSFGLVTVAPFTAVFASLIMVKR